MVGWVVIVDITTLRKQNALPLRLIGFASLAEV
jgi:hypothetical protein